MSDREVSLSMLCEKESFVEKLGRGARVLVLGMGVSGRSVAKLAFNRGFVVSCLDEAECVNFDGIDDLAIFSNWKNGDSLPRHDLIVASPGIRFDSPLGMAAVNSGTPVVGELEFAFSFLEAPILAITGTNGKTTTTEMTTVILGDDAVSAGNIGKPLSEVALQEWRGPVVVETSSFQLESIYSFAPVAAALLNISSDHMDRYATFEDYVSAKFAVFRNIHDSSNCVLNASLMDEWTRAMEKEFIPSTFSVGAAATDAVFKENSVIFEKIPIHPIDIADSRISGEHNVENFMAATILASKILSPDALVEGVRRLLRDFSVSPHRQEEVLSRDGVLFVNDSKATNPNSLFVALDVYGKERNILLIAGGLDKNMDFTISRKRAASIKSVFLIGESADKIRGVWEGEGIDCRMAASFEKAVGDAMTIAVPGDVVMLSPGCASMDMFTNYKERGEFFRKIILQN